MIDPRYDPRFQRIDPATRPVIPDESQVVAAIDGGPDADTVSTTARAKPESQAAQSDDPGANIANSIDEDFIEERSGPPQRNPFCSALLAMGTGLLLIAGVLVYIQMRFQSSNSQDDFIPLDLNIACVPALVLGSIFSFIATIVISGLRRQ